ncbi:MULTISPECIES: glycoside hydrolase family 3 protein [unclassified Sphingomonas]|uniref:glycoside hydrolase family 3 protein n=1 Tax=unclassified Sphingomonas TaxID=196159 RepID=UPI000700DFF5|nr:MULTISPECIES: glycoside hydrolase family 3 protein [unclassified Sphingomonas]KQX23563.1 1,4-beta-D-glucan glucohydrolase [Sphingomonas sp. Root1294]KQY68413.1 1,4-beta-D-glucan glucohydrolase [Sphingomonas sp. Root50]KRB91317.1 1,4-beta-D-glucan glucohydrolase [Sphingomonas sp. Root720]
MKKLSTAATLAALVLVAGCGKQPAADPHSPVAHAELWPEVQAQPRRDPAVEARIDKLLAAMSVADKVGQLIQVDIGSIDPADVRRWKIGAVLSGGNSGPYGDDYAPPAQWLRLADEYYDASIARTDGRPPIPIMWGTDSVHGNNNIVGATLFPHNIGLGAARDRDLIRRIGAATALETAAAGIDWTFAPTLAVVQDDRWGRTYESFSEEPAIPTAYAGAMVEGVQGKVGTADFLSPTHVIATTKHFLGDGGTGGRDQGDARISEQDLRDVHLGGYPAALEAGTQSVMASFSSWNGEKMSGNKSLLTDVLKGRMHFDGFVVGDWNSHGQVKGCTNESCPQAINAGLDMFMYSGPGWKKLYTNTLAQVEKGIIPMARLDDAVRRILRVKIRAGLFERGRPSSRAMAGRFDAIGSPGHRALARRAVRESMVLLKNEGVLPLRPAQNILVAGEAADSISQQSGGWSITWQGADVPNSAFPNGQSIWSGIAAAVKAAGGSATLSPDGHFAGKPDAAIVVFGEKPYAEFRGDRPTLEFSPEDKADLALLRRLKAAGIPVVAVFLSGRPLWVNAEINASDAFVAAFLPGTEGGGVADMLFRAPDGSVPHDFRGRLSFSWPKRPDQYRLNRRDQGYDPLFAYGYGLSYAKPGHIGPLDERRPKGMAAGTPTAFWARGRMPDGWSFRTAPDGAPIEIKAIDRIRQEDSRRFAWAGPAEVRIEAGRALDYARETNGEISLVVDYRRDSAGRGPVAIGMGTRDRRQLMTVTRTIAGAKPGAWSTLAIPLGCFRRDGLDMSKITTPFILSGGAGLALSISDVRIDYRSVPMTVCGDR